ncbi:response regulator [Stieleria varia]|uniref:KDP operon transcriptional regulatory protein KdpE n=1 Tax=Stieleria varia TaxID=2528005 RepID=A0A5C6B314_9BACT|nr:response regulator [Stieleria varia]TWU06280.1 KDP operon transcriptional regulatory protein KdpE [Stieleria varia]
MTDNLADGRLIAVIEDEAPIRKFLRASLRAEGYRVAEADTIQGGLRMITQEPPDLIVLDLGLPDGDGKSLIVEIREWSTVPIIVVSAHDQEREKIAALDAGADDYLTKPFGVGELLARLRVAIRHHTKTSSSSETQSQIYRHGRLRVELDSRRVFLDDDEVRLTKKEFNLLALLARNAGRVMTHRNLLKEIWGPHSTHESHYLRVFVANLRKKLEAEPARPRLIITEQGVGYRLAESEE